MLACWQTYGYFNVVSNNVNKKMTKKALFLATENAEILSFFINRGLARIKVKKLKNCVNP